MVLRFFVDVFI